MSTKFRHFLAIGLTTALAFRVFQDFVEILPSHPTTFDMVWFILMTFFGSLVAISLLIFPIATIVERLSGKWRVARAVCILALPAVIPVILLLLTALFDSNNQLTGGFKYPFLQLALSYAFAGSVLFCVLFYFYGGILCLEWFATYLRHKFKHRRSAALEPN